MIDFRYHLVSIIAVFLALSVGIALGAGPLDQPLANGVQNSANALANEAKSLRTENRDLGARANYEDKLLDGAAAALVSGRLRGVTVVIVALPGAEKATTNNARTAVLAAGATVTGTVRLRRDWSSPDKSEQLDALVAQLAAGTSGASADAQASVRIATALAHAVVVPTEPGGRSDVNGQNFLEQLQVLGYLSFDSEPWRRANFAVVVAPKSPLDPAAEQQETAALLAIPRILDTFDRGTAVVGASGSSDDPSALLAQMRGNDVVAGTVSTVDDIDIAAGRLSLVLALQGERASVAHHYGLGEGASDDPDFSVAGSPAPTPSATSTP